MKLFYKACLLTAFFFSSTSHAVTVGQYKNPSETFLDCDNVDSKVSSACYLAQSYINQKLNDANLYIETEGLVYKQTNDQDIRVKDDCSRRTTIKRQEFDLTLKKTARLNLSGNALSKPAVLALRLPVAAYARFDAKDEFGHKVGIFGPCVRYATDNYWADAGISTTAQMIAFLSLEPKFKVSDQGEFVFALKPIFDLQASIGSTSIKNFDIHGANALLNIISSITSLSSDLMSASESILKGKSVEQTFTTLINSQLIGQAESLLLTDYALSNPLLINQLIDSTVRTVASKSEADLNSNLAAQTAAVKAKIAAALNLDANGKAYIVIGPDFKQRPVTAAHIALMNPPPPRCPGYSMGTYCGTNYQNSEAYSRAVGSCGSCGTRTEWSTTSPGCINLFCNAQ